ncbi:alpha-D-ribose 1-methylphosphonate 5-triphosphate synthase subunit PhnH [Dethiosulfatibacter aminovorans DSM 17477]|uniref:Alpha-D-ribose 1-methylphosphonate 5-triphosphate synthase subunit PhnH n=1 Tax=Dethiosulfatibacter aminovorans DSM 17477 TaxID=1121476 RepID=A0A1M6AYH0_9FIRM|nr:phosphonate C-P lyase system protein PhnH [Dethiosulfatibacter aminovorans]SHI41506.1 alpha-D-ribose 1-methylphosphonate 5-triphosphate synthase subunit PhnH [Dethiosulfatibacter aminovorans DSM 17477]
MLDLVHDVGKAYRKVVDGFSYPGMVVNISEYTESNEIDIPFHTSSFVLALMLLDAEVTFAVAGGNDGVAELIRKFTYSRETVLEEADYVFLLQDASDEERVQAIRNVKVGTLIDPHRSATIIYETPSLNRGEEYVLTGPGIKDETLAVLDMNKGFMEERNRRVEEFPLGMDMIFVDNLDNMVVLPRTTNVKGSD